MLLGFPEFIYRERESYYEFPNQTINTIVYKIICLLAHEYTHGIGCLCNGSIQLKKKLIWILFIA